MKCGGDCGTQRKLFYVNAEPWAEIALLLFDSYNNTKPTGWKKTALSF